MLASRKKVSAVEPSTPSPSPPVLLEPIAYPIKAAAAIVGATEFFIGTAIRNGQLPAKKLGKKYVILRRELEKFVESAEPAA